MDVSFEFADGAADHLKGDAVGFFNKAGEQRLVADGVDEARDAAAVIENPPERGLREKRDALRSGNGEPVLDILGGLKA